jgi:hypothetical protein
MNALLRRLAALTLVPLSLWSAPALAHPTVVVVGGPRSYTPPPVRVEYRPQMPCARAVWIPGSWSWTAYGWQWTSGYWQQPVVYQPARPVYYGYPVPVPRPAYGYERHEAYERHAHDGYGYREHDRGDDGHGYGQGDRPRPPSGHR